ncbi:NAD-dependent epimerase/dehydratase family protein [Vampirovibrio sp.]|uniref:NAD-dependent epimerase/dehydratase family protein n=1 Tax=Vampirovibrio sp. TaxID=2717857 RepID=UPI0035936040
MTLWISGATGFLGRNFLNHLVRHYPDYAITCLVRDPVKASQQWPEIPRNVHWLAGDLLAPETYRDSLRQAERVFHLAALVGLRNGPEFYQQNTEATRCLTDTLHMSDRLERLVYVSSISAIDRPWESPATHLLNEQSLPQPHTDYGKSKLQAEQIIQSSGLPHTILIPAYIYGPHARPNSSLDRLIRDMVSGKSYTRFPFPGEVSEIYVEDLAQALWLAAFHPNTLNQRFLIANPQPVGVDKAYQLLASALGVSWRNQGQHAARLGRYQSRWYQAQPDSLMLRILFERYFACSSHSWYQATGQVPRYGLEEGIQRTVGWYAQQGLLVR